MEKFIRLDSQQLFSGNFLKIRRDIVELPGGKKLKHEVLEHQEVVAVMAVQAGKLLLEKQFRVAPMKEMWEIPAGGVETGETALAAAKRELKEETGYTAKHWKQLISFYTSPGVTDEIIHLFLAEELEAGESSPEEDEVIEIHWLELPIVGEMIQKGMIQDGKTLIGYHTLTAASHS